MLVVSSVTDSSLSGLEAIRISVHLQDRSIYGIIWSSFATIFACTWLAVHQNVPAVRDGQLRVLLRRLAVMSYLLLAPEIVILWAARQHFAAKDIARKHQDLGWTRTHAFFIIMGGFAVYDPRTQEFLYTLHLEEFEELYEKGRLSWPSITEEQIADRSKADYLSKGIVLLQTTWFIVGCIGRAANKLALTELEVVTLAFSALTGILYWLWWNKPLDVRCPFPVYLKPDAQTTLPVENVPVIDLEKVDSPGEVGLPASSSIQPDVLPRTISPIPSHPQPPPHSFPGNIYPWFFVFLSRECQERGNLRGLVYVFVWHPLSNYFQGFDDMVSLTALRPHQRRVPTFYSPSTTAPGEKGMLSSERATGVAFAVVLIFGGIHCIAWNAHFPSSLEKWLWRSSSLAEIALPFIMVFVGAIPTPNENLSLWHRALNGIHNSFLLLGIAIYMVSRVALLALPLAQLRRLPASAFVDVDWVAFFPHVS